LLHRRAGSPRPNLGCIHLGTRYPGAERPALTIRIENVAGAGAKAFRKLADAGVNIDLLLLVRVSAKEFLAVICPENLDAAASALGDQVVSD
jgi:hypothetical protein